MRDILKEAGFAPTVSGVFKSRSTSIRHIRIALFGGCLASILAFAAVVSAVVSHPKSAKVAEKGVVLHAR